LGEDGWLAGLLTADRWLRCIWVSYSSESGPQDKIGFYRYSL
jgi:hypothetical protein